jgi:hypothetical protein
MSFFFFLNKSRVQNFGRKRINLGNEVSSEVKLALEKLREKNLVIFSDFYFKFKNKKNLKNWKAVDREYSNFESSFKNIPKRIFNRIYYKNIKRLVSHNEKTLLYNYNQSFFDYYDSFDVNFLNFYNNLNLLNYIVLSDFYYNFSIKYSGYVSKLLSKSFYFFDFFKSRKSSFFLSYNNFIFFYKKIDLYFFISNYISGFSLSRNSLFDSYNIKNNSVLYNYNNFNIVYSFLFSQRNLPKVLRKFFITNNYNLKKYYLSNFSFKPFLFNVFNRFFLSLGRTHKVYFNSISLNYNLNFKKLSVSIPDDFFVFSKIFSYINSSIIFNNNIFKSGLIMKKALFFLLKSFYTFNIDINIYKNSSQSLLSLRLDSFIKRNNLFFNILYMISLLLLINLRFLDKFSKRYVDLIMIDYISKI